MRIIGKFCAVSGIILRGRGNGARTCPLSQTAAYGLSAASCGAQGGENRGDSGGAGDHISSARAKQAEGGSEREILEGLREQALALPLDGEIVGILHVRNDSAADVVQSDETTVLYGRDYFYEELLGLRFKISLFSFFRPTALARNCSTARQGNIYQITYLRLTSGERSYMTSTAARARLPSSWRLWRKR